MTISIEISVQTEEQLWYKKRFPDQDLQKKKQQIFVVLLAITNLVNKIYNFILKPLSKIV